MAGSTVRRFIADLGYVVHSPAEVFGKDRLDRGLRDEDWLPVIGQQGWAVFGRDQAILQREMELRALLAAKIHMFLLPGEAPRSKIIDLLKINLSGVCTCTSARQPNVYWLTLSGIEEYEHRRDRLERRRHRSS